MPGEYPVRTLIDLVTTKGVRLLVKFLSGDRAWVPMDSARSDNPLPIIETFQNVEIASCLMSNNWKMCADVSQRSMKTIQIPKSIANIVRLNKLNGNSQWQDETQMRWIDYWRIPTKVRTINGF
jgi:hypothetical protein